MLNAILAYEMNQMAEQIKQGKKALDIIKEYVQNHKRIIFEGDSYSEEWQKEAEKRGMPTRRTTVEALQHFTDEKNVQMLSSLGVYSREEIISRHHILLENYAKTVHVEASTALKMAKNELYPVAVQYLKQMADTVNSLNSANIEADFIAEDTKELSALVKRMKQAIQKLENALDSYHSTRGDVEYKALIARDRLVNSMNELRSVTDAIETRVDAKLWPIPSYVELLFDI